MSLLLDMEEVITVEMSKIYKLMQINEFSKLDVFYAKRKPLALWNLYIISYIEYKSDMHSTGKSYLVLHRGLDLNWKMGNLTILSLVS